MSFFKIHKKKIFIASVILALINIGICAYVYYEDTRESLKILPIKRFQQSNVSVQVRGIEENVLRSHFNGFRLTEEEFEARKAHIPVISMISNNAEARPGQYGLNSADVVYEAQVESGITRFMAVYWHNQDENIRIKPVRSTRKYFLDWAMEYGNAPISFSGWAVTDREDTNAAAIVYSDDIRPFYWSWPYKRDQQCAQVMNVMHCLTTYTDWLYEACDKNGWTYDSWTGFIGENEWKFNEELEDIEKYSRATDFGYGFRNDLAYDKWRTNWVYNASTNLYEKYSPDQPHIDVGDGQVVTASTIIIAKMQVTPTLDAEGRVAYSNIGSGEAFVVRDGVRIDAFWEKPCQKCRMRFYERLPNGAKGEEVELQPGRIWVAAVPVERIVEWRQGN